jgi:hypothetical protein
MSSKARRVEMGISTSVVGVESSRAEIAWGLAKSCGKDRLTKLLRSKRKGQLGVVGDTKKKFRC